VRGRKWIRNETCLSAASSFHFPFFDLHKREPEGQRLAVAFFFFLFLARQEKEVAAGLPPAKLHEVAAASASKKLIGSRFRGNGGGEDNADNATGFPLKTCGNDS
jgi:hypothetical protein